MIEHLPTRRGLIAGLGALFLAAPAVVRASSLMSVSAAKTINDLAAFEANLALDARRAAGWIVAEYDTILPMATFGELVGGAKRQSLGSSLIF